MLEFKVHNQTLSRHDDMGVVADSINYLTAHFDLSDSDFGGVTTAVFTPMFTEISKEQILKNNSCVVPWEVIKSRGFKVSLYCNKDDVRITTNEIIIPVEESGFTKGDTPSEPTKTVYEQLIGDVSKAVDIANSIKEQAESGAFNGKDAVTDSELDANSNNAISNSAVSTAIGEIVEQLKNGIITDYWKLENSPFQPVPDAPNPPELLRVPQDLEAGAYIFKEDGVHFNLNGESMYSSAGGLLYVSYYRGNHKAVQYITATDIMFAVSSYDGVQTINMDFLRTQTEINEDIFSGIQQISNWFLPLFSVKAGQLVSVKSADAENLTLELEGVDYPQITTADNTENKQVTDTQICITDNIGKNIKSIICDSYPKQITVVRNNMATCDDFFRDMTNKQAKLVFTNYLDTKYNQGGVTWVYLDGLKTGSYIMSAKSNVEGQTVTKMVRMPTGAVVAPQSTLDEYTFTNNQERTGQIQVRFDPTAVGITATQVYMCKAEDKQVITVNSADDTFDNILGDKNTYLFAEDGSEITVVYETEKKDKPLKGKYLSVLGDSISSYEGYAKNADHIIYPNYDIFKPNRMYWGRFCEMTGAEPLVIDGVGSSTITNIRDGMGDDETFVGMYHDNRAKRLGKDGIVPDIIVIEGGTNDMALNATLGTYDGSTDFPTAANKFREAYAIMLDKIRTEYPKAEIYCSTIMARPNATDYTIKQYNDAIREIAELMGAKIIDFAKCLNVKNYQQFISSDNIHPEYEGHIRMCDEMIKAVL